MVGVGGWVETTGADFNSSVISLHSKHPHFTSEEYFNYCTVQQHSCHTFKDHSYAEELRLKKIFKKTWKHVTHVELKTSDA